MVKNKTVVFKDCCRLLDMRPIPCLSSLLSFFRKWKLCAVLVVTFFLISQSIVFRKFIRPIGLRMIAPRNLSTLSGATDVTSLSNIKALPATTGNLNLHVWFEICAKDLNTLCNFPLFPKAPDARAFANGTILSANDKSAINSMDGLRLFGFITPKEPGLYSFIVQSCSAEVWLGQHQGSSNARLVFSNDNLSQEETDFQVSSEIELKARTKYYIEVVATCYKRRNKLQVLWKTPANASFATIDGGVLSYYYNDISLKDLKVYDDILPDSPACASRRHRKLYFDDQREVSYLSHDDVKDVLPYCEYKPSYTVDYEVPRYHAVTYHVVHTFLFPFPEHANLRDQKNWIYPLDEGEALEVVNIFIESLQKAKPGKFKLEKVLSVERKIDKIKGKRYLINVKSHDATTNRSVVISEYVFMPNDTARQLCYPENFQWSATVPVYLVVTAKNLGRWLQHFIQNAENILAETKDPNLHVIIFDYNSSDINLEEVLQRSSLINYKVLRKNGDYSRTESFNEAINLVTNPQSIVFLLDLHLDITSSLIDSIRKHCIQGRMFYTPIIVELECGANPANLAGIWQVYGYGLIGMFKSDWDRAGGFPINKKQWGGEDWALVDSLFGKGLEFERMRTRHVYHYHHSKKGMW